MVKIVMKMTKWLDLWKLAVCPSIYLIPPHMPLAIGMLNLSYPVDILVVGHLPLSERTGFKHCHGLSILCQLGPNCKQRLPISIYAHFYTEILFAIITCKDRYI